MTVNALFPLVFSGSDKRPLAEDLKVYTGVYSAKVQRYSRGERP